MKNVCDICGQVRMGLMFGGRNEKGEREEKRICFECIIKNAHVGVNLAEVKREGRTSLGIISGIDRVDEDGSELPANRDGGRYYDQP